jgi:hypothetical protein
MVRDIRRWLAKFYYWLTDGEEEQIPRQPIPRQPIPRQPIMDLATFLHIFNTDAPVAPFEQVERTEPPVPRIFRYTSLGPRPLEPHLNCPTQRLLAVQTIFWRHLPFRNEYNFTEGRSLWYRSLVLQPIFDLTLSQLTDFLSAAVDQVECAWMDGDEAVIVFRSATASAAANVCEW